MEDGTGMAPCLHPASEEAAGVTLRRSPRLHPTVHTSEQHPPMTRRRSPRLHPQIEASVDGAGVAPRRSTRLHPHTQASEDGAGMAPRRIRRRRGTSPPAAASLPDDDDMLREILLRLPPQPSSLLRASAVCKRWLGLVTDPKFLRQFRVHHRKPPLLGFFQSGFGGIRFTPVLDPPDRIPPARFSLRRRGYGLLDCRHGLVLLKDREGDEVVVCDPITGEQRSVAVPPEFNGDYFNGAVLRAVTIQGHPIPFKVVLKTVSKEDNQALARVYSSETGEWGNLISAEAPFEILNLLSPATLFGNVLYSLGLLLQMNSMIPPVKSSRLTMALLALPYWIIMACKCGRET